MLYFYYVLIATYHHARRVENEGPGRSRLVANIRRKCTWGALCPWAPEPLSIWRYEHAP